MELPAGEADRFAVPPTVPEDTAEPEDAVGEDAAPGALTALLSNPSHAVGIGKLPPRPPIDPEATPDGGNDEGTPANLVGVCRIDPPNTLMIIRRISRMMNIIRASFIVRCDDSLYVTSVTEKKICAAERYRADDRGCNAAHIG